VKAGTRRTDGRGRLRIPCRRLPARVHRRQRRRVRQGETAVPVLLSFFAGNYLFFDLFTKMKTLVFCEIHLFSRCGLFCCQTGEKSVFLMLYLYVQLFTWFRLPATKESRPVYHRCM
jgi:hypothetical protein